MRARRPAVVPSLLAAFAAPVLAACPGKGEGTPIFATESPTALHRTPTPTPTGWAPTPTVSPTARPTTTPRR